MAAALELDGEAEQGTVATLPRPWQVDTWTLDRLADADPRELLDWACAPTTSPSQIAALEAVVTDPAFLSFRRFRQYSDDPIGFSEDILRQYVISYQGEIMESVRDNRQTSVPSGHGVGKSHISACVIAWWIVTHAPGEAFVVTTAPTMSQVRAILWRYVNQFHASAGLPGRTNVSQWYLGGDLVAIGRKPANTNPAALQGLHAPYLLVLIDEADGVHADIYGALLTLMTTANCRILAIGNPDTNAGRFFDANLPGSGWNTIRIPVFDTPNFNGHPDRTRPDELDVPPNVLANVADAAYVESVATDPHYGIDSDYYRSKVLALAPEDNPRAVMPLSRLRDCMPYRDPTDRKVLWDAHQQLIRGHELRPVEVGIDVGGGGDLTVCRERRGRVLGRALRIKDEDPARQWRQVVAFLNLVGAETVKVEVDGLGWAFAGRLKELSAAGTIKARIVNVRVGAAGRKPNDRRPGFPKFRDQLWFEVGRANTIDGSWDLSALCDEEWVLPELYQPTYEEMLNGLTKVESKADMKKRLGHSPDDADAILLAYVNVRRQARTGAGELEGAHL